MIVMFLISWVRISIYTHSYPIATKARNIDLHPFTLNFESIRETPWSGDQSYSRQNDCVVDHVKHNCWREPAG